MQQLYTTTEPQNEQTPSYASVETAASPEHALTQTEAQQEQQPQEQSEAVERLLATLERDTKKRQKWNKVIGYVYAACVWTFLIIGGLTWLIARHGIDWGRFVNLINLGNALIWLSGSLFLNRKAAAELTTLDDVRCISPLVDICVAMQNMTANKTSARARQALTRLLPRLKASDAHLLREPQRVILRGILAGKGYISFAKYYDAEFIISILKAFEQVGDWKSLPYVQQLAQGAKWPHVRTAANECLPYLQALAEKQKPGENLLRASSASEAAGVAPDTLLRPAVGTEEARPDTLLRAAE